MSGGQGNCWHWQRSRVRGRVDGLGLVLFCGSCLLAGGSQAGCCCQHGFLECQAQTVPGSGDRPGYKMRVSAPELCFPGVGARAEWKRRWELVCECVLNVRGELHRIPCARATGEREQREGDMRCDGCPWSSVSDPWPAGCLRAQSTGNVAWLTAN